ncbi:MAG: ABC transporter ATP-binding protein/permease [Clostridia bacterium]|jgi:ATP-binding cassette subfamily B protein|nr:ABC transporter ATP-binding protein/permease [Clostridia bacterium]
MKMNDKKTTVRQIGPRGRGFQGTRKFQSQDKKTIKRLMQYFKKYRFKFSIVLICIILSSAASVAGSIFIKILIDNYISPLLLSSNPVFAGLLKALGFMATIYIVGIISSLIYNRIMVTIAQGILKTIRDDMFSHMQKLPVKYFDTHSFGDVMSRYTNDTDTLRQMIAMSIPQTFSSAITILVVFCAMLYTSIYLTIFICVFVFIMFKVVKKIGGKSGHYFVKQQQSLGKVNGYIEEMMNGQKVIKVFCHERDAEKQFDIYNDDLKVNAIKANKFANIIMPIMGNMGTLQYVLIAIIGGALAINGVGGLTLGAIASFLQLSSNFSMPISQISQQVNFIVMALAGAERIFNLLDEEPESDSGDITLVNVKNQKGHLIETDEYTGNWAWKDADKGSLTQLKGDVELDNVDFGYEEGTAVLHNISIFAKPGQKVAFVGSTGAGKTTITNLLNRFYDIADGKIHYDGVNINEIKKSDLRRSMGMVLQETNLFTGTVMENIRYGRLDATDEDVYKAAKLANADRFIKMLPDGYDTVISGNGAELSQGQKQLISIARAAIADPPVMILDEATSSIDTRTESIVQKGMDALMYGRTVFVIAHRLSTVQNSDVIMVLEHGRIIERGSHDQLIAQKGRYYQLYTGAFELD